MIAKTEKGSAMERLAIILICFGYLTFGSVYAVISGQRAFDYDNEAVLFVLGLEVAFGAAALLLLRQRGWSRRDIGFEVSRGSTAGALGLLFGTNIVCGVAYLILSASTDLMRGWETAPVRFTAAPALMLLFLIVNSLFEEIFVVGYLIEASPAGEAFFAVSVSALVRLLSHTYQGPLAIATILPLGLIFAAVYLRWRNLWPLVLAHTVMNVAGWAAG